MSYHEEQRRKHNEAPRDRRPSAWSGIEWGLPLGIAGAVLVIGLIFYNVSHQPTTTAGTRRNRAKHAIAESRESGPAGEDAIGGARSALRVSVLAPDRVEERRDLAA